MVCVPLPALAPHDSERPFFSTTTKEVGSDCGGTFTGPLCFQMVLFSCDTVDTQHLPRIRTLLWGSTEGSWVVSRREGRRGKRGEVGRDQTGGNSGGWNVFWDSGFSYRITCLPPHVASESHSPFMVFCQDSLLNEVCFIFWPPPSLWILCPTILLSPLHFSSSAPSCPEAVTV